MTPIPDRYAKLRPQAPTAEAESCRCEAPGTVVLCSSLSPNPVRCFTCNLELPPERAGWTAEEVDAIADWNGVYDAVYRLWLDSGAYEAWAAHELKAPHSSINARGREVARSLSSHLRCYLVLWTDPDEPSPHQCPYCRQPFSPLYASAATRQAACERCQIVVWASAS